MDKEKIGQSRKIISQIQDRIKTAHYGEAEFFLDKAHSSFETSKRLLELIDGEGLNSQMWVINTSYYSMFFAVTALLAKSNRRITGDIGIHKHTFHAFICFFYDKVKQNYILDYRDAIGDSEELLQMSESKTDDLISNYDFEIGKRKKFTYNMGELAEYNKAKTSVNRAKEFLITVEELFDSM